MEGKARLLGLTDQSLPSGPLDMNGVRCAGGMSLSRKATYRSKSQNAAGTSPAATTYRASPAKANKMLNSSNHSLFALAEFHEENLPSGGAWRTRSRHCRGVGFTSESVRLSVARRQGLIFFLYFFTLKEPARSGNKSPHCPRRALATGNRPGPGLSTGMFLFSGDWRG